jgi:hypothetical protein
VQKGANVKQRVELFIQKAKDKSLEEIKSRMGDDYILYNTIAGLNKKASEAADLLGGTKKAVEAGKGLAELGDGRILSGGLQLAISTKRIV